MGNRWLRVLLVGLWAGALALPLTIGVRKLGRDQVQLNPSLGKAAWIAIGVTLAGGLALGLRRLRSGRPRPAEAQPTGASHTAIDLSRASGGLAAAASGRRRLLAWSIPFAVAALLPLLGNPYYVSVGIQTALYICLALGLNIVVGQAGLLVLGYAAFYAVGAYSFGILARDLQLGFWTALPLGGLLAALAGLALGAPTLRLRGDYLAIVTLGFGEMMRVFLITTDSLTGGPNGISGIPRPRLMGHDFADRGLYWLTLALVAVTVLVSDRLTHSRLGRAWMAMREDVTAARVMGISITGMRLLAFSLAAFWAGLCGVVFASKMGFISPESFTFMESVTILAMVVLGGMGSIPGVIAGAIILGLLPELLRQAADYRMITLAGLMIGMMIFRPQGLFPNVRRRLELEERLPR